MAEPGARRRVQDRTEQVALQRMASSVVADRRKMFELFTLLKVGRGACQPPRQEDLLLMLYGSPRYPCMMFELPKLGSPVTIPRVTAVQLLIPPLEET